MRSASKAEATYYLVMLKELQRTWSHFSPTAFSISKQVRCFRVITNTVFIKAPFGNMLSLFN